MDDDKEKIGMIDIKSPLFSATWRGKRTAELIAVLCLAIVFVLGYALWEHKVDAKAAGDQYVSALKLISQAMEDNAVAQREFACLISKDPQERRAAFITSECRRQAEFGTRRN